MAAASSSSRIAVDGFEYDVFLSFRGEDTRYGFTGYLWKALKDKGINTFFDEEDLQRGEEIKPSLLQSIEESRMAVVVLSKNYAFSSFCLDELSHILHCISGNGRFVLPIFYKVDPSDVRKLKGTFGEAMTTHEANSNYSMDRLEKWKKALNQVANFSGTHVKKGDKFQYKLIEEIVEEVSTKIKPMPLHVAKHPVGLGPQMEDVISRLNLGSNDKICMVGIHGIGGVGKTTLAVAVYNSVANQFQGSCYLENVRENFVKHGSTYLQKIILSEIVGEKKFELASSKQGITIIKKRLGKKKVLLLLDDVDKAEQLEAIAGSRDWFGPGSRVIITTRDTSLLTRHDVETTYEVSELNEEDAFELLRQKALGTKEVTPSYMEVLNRALRYASGLPLALEVIGSHFSNKSVEQCKCALDRYERIPNSEIQAILEVSFDALEIEEKCVFLDIACVFKGCELTEVEKVLHAHYGDSRKHHIGVLIEKSLIKIKFGDVTLHDLIADMGEAIEKRESPNDPGSRNRLWLAEDIKQVLEENQGTSKIEMICFNSFIEVKWNGEAFKKMENLKTLIITRGTSLESPKHLPNSLRVLEWPDYSGDLPSEFYPKKLVICRISSNSTSFMRDDFLKKKFETLRILKVDYCNSMTQIPDISGLVNLEEFSLGSCVNLIRIDDSVGLLDKLRTLSLHFCGKIKSIPPLKLPSLEELRISCCDGLESLPPMLEELHFKGCDGLESFSPVGDGILGKLKVFHVQGCKNLKSIPLLKWPSLEDLLLSDCDGLESFSPVADGILGKVKVFSVVNRKTHSDRDFLQNFPSLEGSLLQHFQVSNCWNIRSIPPLKFPLLEEFYLFNCDNLESFPPVLDGSMGNLKILSVRRCVNIKSIPLLQWPSLEKLRVSKCNGLESFSPVVDGIMGKLKVFRVDECENLTSIPLLKWPSLEELRVSKCNGLESFSPVVDEILGKLKVFSVHSCKNFKSIPPLKLPLLEEFTLSYCDGLKSFPVQMDGSMGKLKILIKSCRNLKSFPQLKLASLEKLYLLNCGSLESFLPMVDVCMAKLKVLRVVCCRNHRGIPLIKFASLEELELSCDCCWDHIYKKSRWMGYIKEPHWDDTPLKELPFSFQDLTCLQTLYLDNCGIVQLPTSSLVGMSKQDKDEEKVISIPFSRVELLSLKSCNLSNESLAIGLKWFVNVKELDLSCSNITTLPECIKNCHFLWKLVMDYCVKLQEIKGIPPNTNTISAFNCSSLNSSCTSKLLNQQLHKFGNTSLLLPGVEIPNWFDREYTRDFSFSFWIRNKFPAIVLCVVFPSKWSESQKFLDIKINNNNRLLSYTDGNIHSTRHETNIHHLGLFQIQKQNIHYLVAPYNRKLFVNVEKEIMLENKWNLVEVWFRFEFHKCGIYVLKESSSMEDIRFTIPENEVSM